jgi:cytochrome c peroxidase
MMLGSQGPAFLSLGYLRCAAALLNGIPAPHSVQLGASPQKKRVLQVKWWRLNHAPGADLISAQTVDTVAGNLAENGATGGPITLAEQLAKFFICINDPLGCNGQTFSSVIFTAFEVWSKLTGSDPKTQARRAIARGEQIFNSMPIKIKGVAGLNDVLGQQTVNGFCGTCHDTPNSGNYSVNATLNIGVANAGTMAPPALDISELPVFTVLCTAGPLAGNTFQVTALGRAMISGRCEDIGKTKGPVLRGLTARSPYFHNGAARTIEALVEFYDQRFLIGLTDQQKSDLVAFLETL